MPILGNWIPLDSAAPSLPIKDFMQSETRFAMLSRSHPEDAERFLAAAQQAAEERFAAYKALAEMAPIHGAPAGASAPHETKPEPKTGA